jgi:hypothetical protein
MVGHQRTIKAMKKFRTAVDKPPRGIEFCGRHAIIVKVFDAFERN